MEKAKRRGRGNSMIVQDLSITCVGASTDWWFPGLLASVETVHAGFSDGAAWARAKTENACITLTVSARIGRSRPPICQCVRVSTHTAHIEVQYFLVFSNLNQCMLLEARSHSFIRGCSHCLFWDVRHIRGEYVLQNLKIGEVMQDWSVELLVVSKMGFGMCKSQKWSFGEDPEVWNWYPAGE